MSDAAEGGKQTEESVITKQAEQPENQVEDADKQDETLDETTTEPSTDKEGFEDGEVAEANANNQDEAHGTPETKDADHGPTDVEEPATPPFPKTLEGFGYKFNESGQLRQIKNGEPFVFKVKESDQKYNQDHYEALGEVITEYVYQLLESDVNLIRTDIPVDVKTDEAHSFIFENSNARTAEKLMVLIHGSGVVRAGQWARRLIINDCLDSGTQLPYIKRSLENNYGVLVLNTNRNSDIVNDEVLPVRGSESAEEHTLYVWDHVISKCEAKRIDIVAHSYGGVAVLHLLAQRFDEVKSRVEKIAFTDSAHIATRRYSDRPDIAQWISKHAINWASSDKPLDTLIAPAAGDAGKLSAGTKRHEETSWYSLDSIFKYFTSEKDFLQMVTPEVVTKTEEPVTKTEEPVTKTVEVVTKIEEPVTKTDEVVTKTEEPVTKTEEPVTKTVTVVTKIEEPVTKTDEVVTKTEEVVNKTEVPVNKTEGELVSQLVVKTEDEPVAKTEKPITMPEEEPIIKTEDEPITTTENKPDEPITKPEEPAAKEQGPDKDIDKRIEESAHHQSGKKSTESHPDVEQATSCCNII